MAWGRAPWRPKPLGGLAAALAAAVLLTACAGSGYHYVKNSDDHTYFKVPDNWKLYDEDAIVGSLRDTLSKKQRQAALDTSWQVGFDASSRASLKHIGDQHASSPEGLAIVSQLSSDEADAMSLQTMRNTFVPIDAAVQANTADVQTYEPVTFDGGFHGIHLVATFEDKKGRSSTIDQTSVVDQDTTKMYTLLVTCTTTCYDRNQDKIDNVVKSWTVRDH
jgi:hypothetical protein